MIQRTGTANLPLHGGRVPAWLSLRMAALGRVIVEVRRLDRHTKKCNMNERRFVSLSYQEPPMTSLPPLDHDEIIRRISLDVADGYDEELEMEIEDRHPLPGVYTRAKDVMLERSHIAEAPWWVVQAVDKKRARLNCIDHLLKQFQYHETPKTPIVLPQREHHEHYSRQAVPTNMLVPEVY